MEEIAIMFAGIGVTFGMAFILFVGSAALIEYVIDPLVDWMDDD